MNFSARQFFVSSFFAWIVLGGIFIYLLVPLRKTLRFGIDLVGGTYLTLKVKTDKAIEAELTRKLQSIESRLKSTQKPLPISKKIENEKLILTFNSIQDVQSVASFLRSDESTMVMHYNQRKHLEQTVTNNQLELVLPSAVADYIKDDAVHRNIEVLRTRLNPLSIAEIQIAAQGKENIIVELPDVSDPQEAKALIGKSAQLDFRLVEKIGSKKEDILYEYDGELPADKEILPGREGREVFYLVDKFPEVTGADLKDAAAGLGGKTGNEAVVKFQFTDEGGDKFYELTSKNQGRQLAIVLDGQVLQAPSINASIRESGEISGSFTPTETHELALLLKSGAFVAPVTFEEERHIGPSLGAESIRQGFIACLVGLVLLFVFSLYYYRLAGFLAFVALLYNMLFILVCLKWLGATLTLPGIAGIMLTIGMAIDASILIYEHIKDQLAAGITLKQAIKSGFSGASAVILDANITTFIVGIVLYNFGSGPVQGFAVTLMLGIIATLVTGILFLRSLFTVLLNTFDIQKLKI